MQREEQMQNITQHCRTAIVENAFYLWLHFYSKTTAHNKQAYTRIKLSRKMVINWSFTCACMFACTKNKALKDPFQGQGLVESVQQHIHVPNTLVDTLILVMKVLVPDHLNLALDS